jgi:hypothetical protein
MSETEEVSFQHEFSFEIQFLVIQNHTFTIRGIGQAKRDLLDNLKEKLAPEDHDIPHSAVRQVDWIYNDLKAAANHTALVSLVTRIDHWTRKLVMRLSLVTNRKLPPVTRDMQALNDHLGNAPIPVEFFTELVTARDSVVHADSQAEWQHNGKRCVAPRYAKDGKLRFTESDLNDALSKAEIQIEWYDKRTPK